MLAWFRRGQGSPECEPIATRPGPSAEADGEQKSRWADLPAHLLAEVAQRCCTDCPRHAAALRAVCGSWRQALDAGVVSFVANTRCHAGQLAALAARLSGLQSLHLYPWPLQVGWRAGEVDALLTGLARLPALRNLATCQPLANSEALSALTQLRCLDISLAWEMRRLPHLPQLTHLSLSGCWKLEPQAWQALVTMSGLRHLRLRKCGVSTKCTAALGALTGLERLELAVHWPRRARASRDGPWLVPRDSEHMSESDNSAALAAALARLTALTRLELCLAPSVFPPSAVEAAPLAAAAALPRLSQLILLDWTYPSRLLRPDIVAKLPGLAGLRRLRRLSLRGWSPSALPGDGVAAQLTALTRLTRLDLVVGVTAASLLTLAALPALVHLDLGQPQRLRGRDLLLLERLPKLATLRLAACYRAPRVQVPPDQLLDIQACCCHVSAAVADVLPGVRICQSHGLAGELATCSWSRARQPCHRKHLRFAAEAALD